MVEPGAPKPGDYGDAGGYIGKKVGKFAKYIPILGRYIGPDELQAAGKWIWKNFGADIDQTITGVKNAFHDPNSVPQTPGDEKNALGSTGISP